MRKGMTKQEQNIVWAYNATQNRGLYECYANPSANKIRAYNQILDEKYEKCGFDLRVLSFNSFMFTVAYTYLNDKGEEVLVYHTPTRRQEIIIR